MRAFVGALPFDVEGKRILDLAAGPGALTDALVQADVREVVWQDVEPAFEREARARLDGSRVRFEVRDMLELPYDRGSFDAVFILEALHWAHDESLLLRRLADLTARDGWIVITGLNYRRALAKDRSMSPARRLAHLVVPLVSLVVGRKVATTIWVSERATRRRLERAGFTIVTWRREGGHHFHVIARKS
jgi:2-polyprenyl-3-methyl-5-hydroxy-6-metoxy-1,4-benzoquinol methylase